MSLACGAWLSEMVGETRGIIHVKSFDRGWIIGVVLHAESTCDIYHYHGCEPTLVP